MPATTPRSRRRRSSTRPSSPSARRWPRVPRAGLNRERVVDEATAVADAVGFDRLSLAAVAERTGVRRDVAVRALEELAAAVTPTVGARAGEDGLRALAGAYRDYARQHPGRYAATVRAPRPGDEAHAVAAEA